MPHTQTSGFFLCFNSFHPRSKKSGCTLPSQTAPTNRFTFNFPIKFTGTYRMPLFHFLMACAVKIVSRTFLHALGISNSLKLLFQARPAPSPLLAAACLALSKFLATPAPGHCSSQEGSDLSPWRAMLASFELPQRQQGEQQGQGPRSKRRLVWSLTCVPLTSSETSSEVTSPLGSLLYKMGVIMPTSGQ